MNRALEGSNTVVFEEMAEMLTGFRSFDMSQKIMRTQSGMESEMIKSYGV
jgi:flagellar basal body rod protein FlgG